MFEVRAFIVGLLLLFGGMLSAGAICQPIVAQLLVTPLRPPSRNLPGFEGVRAAMLLSVLLGVGLAVNVVSLRGEGASLPVFVAVGLSLISLAVAAASLRLLAGALLYFKARQAAGEPLLEALEQFERQALPGGYWQEQVRDRIRRQVEWSR